MLPTDNLRAYISQNNLLKPDDRLVLGVSGGKDSVLMAHLFHAAGYQFSIAHCNFCLRGEESDGDEAFTRSLAARLQVPFHHVRFDTKEAAAGPGVSIQMAARKFRYEWFDSLCREHQYTRIAIAHHKSDSTETVLLNLIRGTGISGLHGILNKRGQIIRPLLFLSSDEIDYLVSANEIAYREDSSNASVKYARNLIRHEIIPKMKQLNEGLDATFEHNSRRFLQLETYLNEQVAKLRLELFKFKDENTAEIDLEALRQLRSAELLLFELFRPYHFEENILQDLIRSWHSHSGKIFRSGTHTLLLDRGKLILRKRDDLSDLVGDKKDSVPKLLTTMIFKDTREFYWKENHFKVSRAHPEDIHFSGDSKKAYFDADLLQFPLILRQWKEGDYFCPLGMKGRKKVSDFFINRKLSRFEKQGVGILENGNDDILWLVGHRSDNRYKVTAETKNIYIIELSE